MMNSAKVDEYAPPLPVVSQKLFMAVAWSGLSLSTALVFCRFSMRYRYFRRLFIDDLFVAIAWLLTLATTIIWSQIAARGLYMNMAQASSADAGGTINPTPDFVERAETFLKASAAVLVLLFCILWSIKLSFLLFFRRLYSNIGGRWMKCWWAILPFTGVTWLAVVGSIQYTCLVDPLEDMVDFCSSGYGLRYQKAIIITSCAIDVATDIPIIMIPICILRKVQISMRRKLALGALFSVTILTIASAIARVSRVDKLSSIHDVSWFYLWSNIECYACLIVTSVGCVRCLFTFHDSGEDGPLQGDFPPTIGQGGRKRTRSQISSGSLFNSSSGGTRQASVCTEPGDRELNVGTCSDSHELMDHGLLHSDKRSGVSIIQRQEAPAHPGEAFDSKVELSIRKA